MQSQLSAVMILVVFVAAAYLLTHFVVGRLQRRYMFVTGLEYIVLGVLLGPAIPELRAFEDLTSLAPVIALGAGWVGLLSGMQLDLFHARTPIEGSFTLALLKAGGTGILVAGAAYAFFTSGWIEGVSPHGAGMSAGVMGCAAAAGSSTAVELLAERYHLRAGLIALLQRAARTGDLLAISAFGTLFCIFHLHSAGGQSLGTAEWIAISGGAGILLGLLFTVFIAEDESENSRFLALVGIITFASGAAFFLRLSPLFVNMLLGIVLVNTEKSGEAIVQTLERTHRPMTLILLVFAGALWTPPPVLPAIAATLGLIALRILGSFFGCWLASFARPLRADLGRGLLAQGDVAVAMAVSFKLVYEGPAVSVAYTAILASIVVHELLAPRVLRDLLIDAGEVRREVPARG